MFNLKKLNCDWTWSIVTVLATVATIESTAHIFWPVIPFLRYHGIIPLVWAKKKLSKHVSQVSNVTSCSVFLHIKKKKKKKDIFP